MPIYTGKTADGSDMKEAEGVYVSEDGSYWSNMPITKEHRRQAKEQRDYDAIFQICSDRHLSMKDLYQLVLDKKSTMLSSRQKRLLAEIINTPH